MKVIVFVALLSLVNSVSVKPVLNATKLKKAAASSGSLSESRLTDQTVCSGGSYEVIVTDINETPSNTNDGKFARVGLIGVPSIIIPATSAICLNVFAFYWQANGRLEMLDSSFISQDCNSNFIALGSITVGDNSGIQLGVGAGWFQGTAIGAHCDSIPYISTADVTIDANTHVQLDIAAIFQTNGHVKLNDNVLVHLHLGSRLIVYGSFFDRFEANFELDSQTVVNLHSSSHLTVETGGVFILDAHTVLSLSDNSALRIGEGSKLRTAYLIDPVNINLGQFSELTIADNVSCVVTANEVTVPDFTSQIWDANFTATGVMCAGVGSEGEAALESFLKKKALPEEGNASKP